MLALRPSALGSEDRGVFEGVRWSCPKAWLGDLGMDFTERMEREILLVMGR